MSEDKKEADSLELEKKPVRLPDDFDDEEDSGDDTAYIEKLKKDAIKWRAKAKENKDAAAKYAEADARLKEAQSNSALAMQQVEQMRAVADKRIINAELRALATEFGLKKMDYIKLADTSKLSINDAGEVMGGRELIESLKNSDPDLFKMPTTTNIHFQPGQKSEVRVEKEVLKMSKEEYAKKERDFLRERR